MGDNGDVKEDEVEDPDAPVVVTTEAVTVTTEERDPQRPADHPDDEGDEGESAPGTEPFDQDDEMIALEEDDA